GGVAMEGATETHAAAGARDGAAAHTAAAATPHAAGPHLRAKIVPRLDEVGAIVVTVEWIRVDGASNFFRDSSGPPRVEFREGFRVLPRRFGTGYVSQVGCREADYRLPPFAVNTDGSREFVLSAATASVPLAGNALAAAREVDA